MIAALGGVLTLARSKAVQWAAAVAAAIAAIAGFALFERRAGAQGVRVENLEREVADVHTAAKAASETARETDDQVLADLLRDARR